MVSEIKDADALKSQLLTESIIKRSQSAPIYLSAIEINGGERFSNNFFKKLLYPLVDKSDYTLSQLIKEIGVTEERLLKTNVFKDIGISLHSDYANLLPSSVKNYNNETPISTKLVLDLSAINLNINESFLNYNTQDNLNVNLDYLNNNFNNNAELVNIGVNYNPYKPNDHLITNFKGLASLNNPSYKFLLNILHSQENNQVWQQSSHGVSGGLIGLQYSPNTNFQSLTGLTLSRRTLHNIDDAAPDELKFFAGDYFKSSILQQIDYSDLSYLNSITKNFPVQGTQQHVDVELASNQEQQNPNNIASFIRAAYNSKYYRSFLHNYFTAKVNFDFGGIFPLSTNTPVHISDRFYLGGIDSFNGFIKNGINTNGGLQFYKLQGTLFSKLPSFIHKTKKESTTLGGEESNPLRLYITSSLGNVSDNIFEDDTGASNVGVGLRYFNYWANFDIGYFIAKRFGADHGDESIGIKDGFHFSVSLGGSNRSL
ncbi:SAM50-like protein [Scheffersomyces coipomensis]|uniref:SAM50-like protein n=1 Tax=Scheffersomyces coipomensis TaxID=1788519 RepID=UPI00315D8FD6